MVSNSASILDLVPKLAFVPLLRKFGVVFAHELEGVRVRQGKAVNKATSHPEGGVVAALAGDRKRQFGYVGTRSFQGGIHKSCFGIAVGAHRSRTRHIKL